MNKKTLTKWANWQHNISLTVSCPRCDSFHLLNKKRLEEIGIEPEDYLAEGRDFEYEYTCDDCGETFIINELING